MRWTVLVINMVATLMLRRILAAAADTVGGGSAFCSKSAEGSCGLKTSPVLFQDLQTADIVVSYEQLKDMLSSRIVQLFDVRNPDEFQAGRIPESTNIPLDQLEEALKLSSEHFLEQFHVALPKKTDDNVVFHCQRGRRSLTALEIAYKLGFNKARHYAGGYSEWEQRGKL